MNIIRKHFLFSGRVQGVGFRYRAYYAAQKYGVTGYVKNCYDSTVEMEAEGSEENIDRLILDLEKGTFIYIENMRVTSIPVENSHSFEITG